MRITRSGISEYLGHCEKEKRLSGHTLRAYKIDLDQFFNWLEGGEVRLFDRGKLKAYVAHLNENYAASSVRRKIASVRAFSLYWCAESGAESPFADMRVSIREPKRLPRTISLGDLAKLLGPQQIEEERDVSLFERFLRLRDRAILEVLVATGIRVSELCGLDIENCDLAGRQARIHGKGAKERLVQLENEETLHALERYFRVRDEWLLEGCRKPSRTSCCQAVFLNRFGERMSEQSVRAAISRRAQGAGVLLHITPHMFRHTFATMLLEDDVNLRYIQSLLGHASVKTTERYTHVARAKQREVMRKHNPRNAIGAMRG
ncbi:tyrosine-type recombinase/integrase [Adlercreutzia caecimuris]|uniref:tyrosine-type recombinase/integrase n=1 Tax=Adlercreutzia caecimuris TaxID=671266 RepID=UPI00214BBDCD|nr:tyrosine-type recombinase/integrase [Adlercreutzia caecimuris]MCR2038512.1 tyrosine-type recombinase/integrase [Adlercreutzia caecimuris]